ncbi:hypothetical protein JCM19376_17810 [Fusibacter bizertensis]
MDDLRLHGVLGDETNEKNFLLKYDGVSNIIKDLKGKPINVQIGDYVYNEFNSTQLMGETFVKTYDRTGVYQFVNAAYETVGNGGRKLLKLDNGWLVGAVMDDTNSKGSFVCLYLSKDNGATSVLETKNGGYALSGQYPMDVAIASKGKTVYGIITNQFNSNDGYVFTFRRNFDNPLNNEMNISIMPRVDGADLRAIGNCSLAINSNGHLFTSYSSKSATYPNSFNINFSESTDGGETWMKPIQISSINTIGQDYINPCIFVDSELAPKIIFSRDYAGNHTIFLANFGSSWSISSVHNGASYIQNKPSATVQKYGTYANEIGVAWQGYGASHPSTYHIFFKSTNKNAPLSSIDWSELREVAIGENPSLTCDALGNYYVEYERSGVIYGKSSSDGGANWSDEYTLGTGTNVSVCDNHKEFEKPLTLFEGDSDVKFYGKWEDEITPVQVIPPISLATSKTELQALYTDNLKMHNINTDARYQGFVSKKDLWTAALQELDWTENNIKLNINMFGKKGNSNFSSLASGEHILYQDTNEKTVFNGTMTAFEVEMKGNGTVRISFEMRTYSDSYGYRGVIKKNGIDVGKFRDSNSTSWISYTEDFSYSDLDRFSLSISISATAVYARNFKIKVLNNPLFNVIV